MCRYVTLGSRHSRVAPGVPHVLPGRSFIPFTRPRRSLARERSYAEGGGRVVPGHDHPQGRVVIRGSQLTALGRRVGGRLKDVKEMRNVRQE